MKFIEVTSIAGQKFLINTGHIILILPKEEWSEIWLTETNDGHLKLIVVESYDELKTRLA